MAGLEASRQIVVDIGERVILLERRFVRCALLGICDVASWITHRHGFGM